MIDKSQSTLWLWSRGTYLQRSSRCYGHRWKKVAGLHPTDEPLHPEPSGNVAVRSDSTFPSPDVGSDVSGIASDQTIDLTPGPPDGPPQKRDVPAPPAAFGRYHVRNVLGTGGFGAVYLCQDTQLDRPVAVKVLRGGPDVSQADGGAISPGSPQARAT